MLDVSKHSNLCDYFVICSGDSSAQVNAIFELVQENCKKENLSIHHWEKDDFLNWILVDFFDVILHIFMDDARNFYNLENLWSQTKKIKIKKIKKIQKKR